MDQDGVLYHEACNTKPLSVVDASNRIIASMRLAALERGYADWVSDAQRGFIKGRQMLRNILDVDFSAQRISLQSERGATVLFDFRAAFPSLSHDFLFDALSAIGLPTEYTTMLRLFYRNNKHKIRVGNQMFDSVHVHSGVRQGCPLSPLLFALCADILLREISATLRDAGIVRAFVDDTAVVLNNWERKIVALERLFSECEQVSASALNVNKTVFIPM